MDSGLEKEFPVAISEVYDLPLKDKGVNTYGRRMIARKFRFPPGRVNPEGSIEKFAGFGGTQTVPSAIVFPLTDGDRVLMVKQWRPWPEPGIIWELPGGDAKKGQSAEEAALSELLSETGYRATTLQILNAGNAIAFDPASVQGSYLALLARGCEKFAEPNPDRTEFLDVYALALDTVREMIKKGDIRDSKTLAVLFLGFLEIGF